MHHHTFDFRRLTKALLMVAGLLSLATLAQGGDLAFVISSCVLAMLVWPGTVPLSEAGLVFLRNHLADDHAAGRWLASPRVRAAVAGMAAITSGIMGVASLVILRMTESAGMLWLLLLTGAWAALPARVHRIRRLERHLNTSAWRATTHLARALARSLAGGCAIGLLLLVLGWCFGLDLLSAQEPVLNAGYGSGAGLTGTLLGWWALVGEKIDAALCQTLGTWVSHRFWEGLLVALLGILDTHLLSALASMVLIITSLECLGHTTGLRSHLDKEPAHD